jgi:hypothetical protein
MEDENGTVEQVEDQTGTVQQVDNKIGTVLYNRWRMRLVP